MPLDISEQIRKRKTQDSMRVSDAFVGMSGIVVGEELYELFSKERIVNSENAIRAILNYFRFQGEIDVSSDKPLSEQLAEILQPKGILQRKVRLTEGWYKNAFGVYIGTLKNESVVALLPFSGGYVYIDNTTNKAVKINEENAGEINETAICFYRPFPQEKLNRKSLLRFMSESLAPSDYFRIVLFTALATLAGMLVPAVMSFIYNEVIFVGRYSQLTLSFAMIVTAYFTVFGINQFRSIYLGNVRVKLNAAVNSAVMMRMLSLPMGFFNSYPSGTITRWVMILTQTSASVLDFALSTVLGTVMCLLYVFQVFTVRASLVIPTFLFLALQIGFSAVAVWKQTQVIRRMYDTQSEEEGFLYSMLTGIQKIRISGAENRVFANWAERYREVAKNNYNPPFVVKYYELISILFSLIAALFVYLTAMESDVSGAGYMVFLSIFTLLNSSLTTLTGAALLFASVPAALGTVKPFLEATPEVFINKKVIHKLNGDIQLRHLKFRYEPDAPLILNDISLDIASGAYVAIVGKSGCGKSTLIKLLLGLEKAESGSIFFDNNDLTASDIRSIRRRIGTVMQNASLFPGSLKYNISVNAPGCSEEDIWSAVRMAGLEDVVKRLPMGLETMVSGSGGGLSGGQIQRVAIARAIVSKPDIIIFDEATSALDNITQRIVVDSLDTLKCTRIVVAHRLSTIRTCDRIIMLEGGRIIEDGTYDELIANDGAFAKLVKRQQIQE